MLAGLEYKSLKIGQPRIAAIYGGHLPNLHCHKITRIYGIDSIRYIGPCLSRRFSSTHHLNFGNAKLFIYHHGINPARLSVIQRLCIFQFVSHAYCQRKLMSLWTGHLKQMVTSRMWWLQTLTLVVAYPFFALVCIFYPFPRVRGSDHNEAELITRLNS